MATQYSPRGAMSPPPPHNNSGAAAAGPSSHHRQLSAYDDADEPADDLVGPTSPSIKLPTLHLGSFHSLKLEDFGMPSPSGEEPASASTRRSPRRLTQTSGDSSALPSPGGTIANRFDDTHREQQQQQQQRRERARSRSPLGRFNSDDRPALDGKMEQLEEEDAQRPESAANAPRRQSDTSTTDDQFYVTDFASGGGPIFRDSNVGRRLTVVGDRESQPLQQAPAPSQTLQQQQQPRPLGNVVPSPTDSARRRLPRPPAAAASAAIDPHSSTLPPDFRFSQYSQTPMSTARPPQPQVPPLDLIPLPRPVRISEYDLQSRAALPGLNESPYPSAARPQPQRNDLKDNVLEDPRRPNGAPLRVKVPPPQEEICLECLMRDRDLAHVDVLGPGVWRRDSDADFADLLARERECDNEWETQSRRGSMQGSDPDADSFLRQRVRWRGFDWEESRGGTGLPRAFRGRIEGELREEKLKELALRMTAPSAHRLKKLQIYLRDQAALVDELFRTYPELRQERRRETELAPAIPPTQPLQLSGQRFTTESPVVDDRQRNERYGALRQTMYSNMPEGGDPSFSGGRVPRRPSPQALPLDARKGRGISSPGLLENASTLSVNNNYDRSEQLTPQIDPDASSMRPFSFAVRAQAPTSARSSPGPRASDPMDTRRASAGGSVFGRWGGSVTSFFGGSQGGMSGSMMDMHDRRRYPEMLGTRSVSMAAPPRPRFFSRSSRDSATWQEPSRESTAAAAAAAEAYKPEKKKKGIKGFFRKMAGKGKRESRTSTSSSSTAPPVPDEDVPLAPPPSLSYLVERMDRPPTHKKSPSQASLSALVTNQPNASPSLSSPDSATQQWPPSQGRPLSAVMAQSPSKASLLSSSPSSSRFREAQAFDDRRRSSGPVPPIREDHVEGMDRQPPLRRNWSDGSEAVAGPFRGMHGKAASSTSSGAPFPPSIESPPYAQAPHFQAPFIASQSSMLFAPPQPPAANKGLPPLPPPQSQSQSPEERQTTSPRKAKSRFGLKSLFAANLGVQPAGEVPRSVSQDDVQQRQYASTARPRSKTNTHERERERQTYYQ